MEKEIERLEHTGGCLQNAVFRDGEKYFVKALYTRCPFEQHCGIPEALGCELTEDGYVKRTTAGAMVNREIILEEF
ncbi:MAG TPA: hypothetical protein VHC48_09740 [Puia sp.]|nr:hypothetical protein [Puia sp.]